MNKQTTIIGSLTALVLLLIIGFMVWFPRTGAAQTPTTDSRKRITVVGRGEVKVVPDIARITVGVQSQAPDAATALADNNSKMNALVEQLKAAGIADKDMQTVGVSIYPTYDYNANTSTITGYQVSNAVNVTVNVGDAGGLLDKVVAVGANNVSGISFDVSDTNASMEQARKAAIADAKLRADQYASAGNTQVGGVLVISELTNQLPVFEAPQARDLAQGAGGSAPILPGQQSQIVEVQVTFELK